MAYRYDSSNQDRIGLYSGADSASTKNISIRHFRSWPFTWMLWVRINGSSHFSGDQTFCSATYSSNMDYALEISFGYIEFSLHSYGSFNTGIGMPLNKWVLATASFHNNNKRYICQNDYCSIRTDYAAARNSNDFAFGRWNDTSPSNYLDGDIGPCCFWKAGLEPTEIAYLYNNGKGRPFDLVRPNNLIAWFDFEGNVQDRYTGDYSPSFNRSGPVYVEGPDIWRHKSYGSKGAV